jgi:hypothetical protein
MKQLFLLPQPRSVKWDAGKFRISENTAIVLPRTAPPQVVQLALDLQAFIANETGIRLEIVKAWSVEREANVIELDFAAAGSRGSSVAPRDGAENRGGTPLPRTTPLNALEEYSLSITPQRVTLRGSALGLIWAERTLRQIIGQCRRRDVRLATMRRYRGGDAAPTVAAPPNLPCVKIADAPQMRFRGVMLDVSRGRVPTLETLLGLVEQMSFFKLNVLQLYTEHTFAFRHLPLIGKGHGALTSEDMLRLDAHCRRNGVELMPCLQAFGHMYHILKLKPYQHLAEVKPDKTISANRGLTISPGMEESYELLEKMFDDFLPSFSSGFCNVNCDETYDLGKGASKSEAERIGIGRVYLNHILRLHKIVTGKHGKRMMMWGDIILNHPELIAELPKDIIVMNWGYEAQEKYETTKQFAACGLTHWVCPGTSSWNTIAPRVNNACANISRFVAAGIETGASGMLNTDWGDGGHYNLQGLSWHGYAFGAEAAWSGAANTGSVGAKSVGAKSVGAGSGERGGAENVQHSTSNIQRSTAADSSTLQPINPSTFDAAFGRLFFGEGGEKIGKAFRALGSACDNAAMNLRNCSRTMWMLFGEFSKLNELEQTKSLTPLALKEAERTARETGKVFAAALREKGWTREQLQTLREYKLAADLLGFAARRTLMAQEAGNAQRSTLNAQRSGRLAREKRALVARFKELWLARAKPEGMEIALERFERAR